jgi:hypothetical protein
VKAAVGEVSRFYKSQSQGAGTHFALRWDGRVRYTVPREAAAQQACWKTFHPGRLELPLRAMARLPRLFDSVSCVEAERLASIREAIGQEAGFSCCRAGAPGPWSKDTILLLGKKTAEPLYVVKAGDGKAVDSLLQNEVRWLQTLRSEPLLIDHAPELVAHRFGTYLSFVAETPLLGKLDFKLGEPHFAFLRKFQEYSHRTIRYEDSGLYRNLRLRLKDLSGLLSKAWSIRIERAMRQIEQSLSGALILFVATHNDFTPWNIRVEHNMARVFDWEYADNEQLPLFDPLHFSLMPMALKRRSTAKTVQKMCDTLHLCRQQLGKESCYESQTQVLAYLMNICSLYLWGVRHNPGPHSVLEAYAHLIDHLLSADMK